MFKWFNLVSSGIWKFLYCAVVSSLESPINYIIHCSDIPIVSHGCSQDFSKGGHTVKVRVLTRLSCRFSPTVVGCLLKNAYKRGVMGTPDPLSYALVSAPCRGGRSTLPKKPKGCVSPQLVVWEGFPTQVQKLLVFCTSVFSWSAYREIHHCWCHF